ncbi:MAG: TatD family hydrolase [Candidatus Syntrophosphaera sp.]|nr:TatD family hydrolase [Candidatus Syntrophosphaera sp.]
MKLTDAHCHLANLNELMPLEPLLEEAKQKGIIRFLSSVLSKSEIAYHIQHPHPEILVSAGIHPNFEDCDLELADISALCEENQIWAVGEIGLDRGNPDLDWQKGVLAAQLDLAAEYKLPVVLHIIGFQQQAYEILKNYPLRYLVHSYAGSLEGYRLLARLDSFFTISERILRPDKLTLLREIVASGAYLFETDITRYYVKDNEPNPLLRLVGLFCLTAEVLKLEKAELERGQSASLAKLLGGRA